MHVRSFLLSVLLFKQPPREVIISVFLPLGPAGQGGEALLHLGLVAYRLFPTISALPSSEASSVGNQLTYAGASQLGFPVGQALFAAGLLGALMLWAFGMWWMALGIMTVIRETRRGKLTFNMGCE
jgi:tellurite resistance protein TehA-like permease